MSSRYQAPRSYPEQLLLKMSDMRNSRTLTDISLEVGGKLFDVHRVVLAASSEFFRSLFTSEMRESCAEIIPLKGSFVTPEVFQIILDFVYKSELNITENSALKVLVAADYLQMESVVKICSDFVSEAVVSEQLKKMDIQSLQKVLNTADRHSFLDLRDKVFHRIALDFKNAADTEEFLEHIEANNLLGLLQRNDLTAPSETFVFKAVLKWIYYDKEKRLSEAFNLIRAVRLGLVAKTVLKTELTPELCGTKEWQSFLQELPPVNSETRTKAPVLIAVKYEAPLKFYDTTKQQWKEFGENIPVNEACRAVVCSCSYIYVGGMKTVYRYNIDSNIWDQLPSMGNTKNGRYQLLVLGDYLYAIGPQPERYSFREKSWQAIADIVPTENALDNSCAAAVIDGNIFTVGSRTPNENALVHCYDPSRNQWEQKASSLKNRINGCTFQCNGKLRITGGKTKKEEGWVPLETTESYCKETDSWSLTEPKCTAPEDLSFAFEVDDMIFFRLNNFVLDSGIRVSPDQALYPVKFEEWSSNVAALDSDSLITCTHTHP